MRPNWPANGRRLDRPTFVQEPQQIFRPCRWPRQAWNASWLWPAGIPATPRGESPPTGRVGASGRGGDRGVQQPHVRRKPPSPGLESSDRERLPTLVGPVVGAGRLSIDAVNRRRHPGPSGPPPGWLGQGRSIFSPWFAKADGFSRRISVRIEFQEAASICPAVFFGHGDRAFRSTFCLVALIVGFSAGTSWAGVQQTADSVWDEEMRASGHRADPGWAVVAPPNCESFSWEWAYTRTGAAVNYTRRPTRQTKRLPQGTDEPVGSLLIEHLSSFPS